LSCITTAATWLDTLSLHDALPIFRKDRPGKRRRPAGPGVDGQSCAAECAGRRVPGTWIQTARWKIEHHAGQRLENVLRRVGFAADRKSTRLNSSHVKISYAVFCLK